MSKSRRGSIRLSPPFFSCVWRTCTRAHQFNAETDCVNTTNPHSFCRCQSVMRCVSASLGWMQPVRTMLTCTALALALGRTRWFALRVVLSRLHIGLQCCDQDWYWIFRTDAASSASDHRTGPGTRPRCALATTSQPMTKLREKCDGSTCMSDSKTSKDIEII